MGFKSRTIAEGSNLWAFIEEGTTTKTYRPFANQKNCSITDDGDQRESTSKNVGPYANYQYSRDRWSASLEMLVSSDTDADEVDVDELYLMRKAKHKPTVFFAYVDNNGAIDTTRKAHRGKVLLKVPLEAPDGELQKATIAMQGCLELEYLEFVDNAWAKIDATYPPATT